MDELSRSLVSMVFFFFLIKETKFWLSVRLDSFLYCLIKYARIQGKTPRNTSYKNIHVWNSISEYEKKVISYALTGFFVASLNGAKVENQQKETSSSDVRFLLKLYDVIFWQSRFLRIMSIIIDVLFSILRKLHSKS